MTDPRWQTVRERMHYAEMCGFGGFSDALAALDSLEAEMDILATDYWDAENRVKKAEAEAERLREALRDYAERGVRADLNPTRKIPTPDSFWLSYLERIDRQVRDRARAALGGEE